MEPQRTPSGYRKFTHEDLQRLRYVLAAQRDHYLPLKVIREHLDALDRGLQPPDLPGSQPRVPMTLVSSDGLPSAEAFARDPSELRLSRERAAGGLGRKRGAARPSSRRTVSSSRGPTTTTAMLWRSPRRWPSWPPSGSSLGTCGPYKAAADREVGLVEQVVAPLRRARGADAAGQGRRGRPGAGGTLGPAALGTGQVRPRDPGVGSRHAGARRRRCPGGDAVQQPDRAAA